MKGDTEITNDTDVIDSRDIIERIEYLEDLLGFLYCFYAKSKPQRSPDHTNP